MKRLLAVLAIVLMGAMAPQAEAAVLIDFSYHNVSAGTITMSGTDLATTNIPIAGMSVSGLSTGDLYFDVIGGILSFDTATGVITITGTINGLNDTEGKPITGTLLWGTITNSQLMGPVYGNYTLYLSGTDYKNADMLTAIGLDPETEFAAFGTVAVINQQRDGTYSTNSVDINNTAVPEPGSMLLLGTGLFGLAGAARRRFKK